MTFGNHNLQPVYWEQYCEYVTNGRQFRVLRVLWNDAIVKWLDTGAIDFIGRPRDEKVDQEAEKQTYPMKRK